jgi:hypothetical protein
MIAVLDRYSLKIVRARRGECFWFFPSGSVCCRTLRDKRRLAPAASHASHHGPTGAQAAPPADSQMSASSPGWTDRVPIRPDQVCPTARYGVYPVLTLRRPACHSPHRSRRRVHHGTLRPPQSPGGLQQAAAPRASAATGQTAGTLRPCQAIACDVSLRPRAPPPAPAAARPHAG